MTSSEDTFGANQLISFRGLYTDRTISNQGVGGYTLPEGGAEFEDREDLFYLFQSPRADHAQARESVSNAGVR